MATYIRSAENSCCLSNTFICDWRVGQNNYRWRLQHFTQNRYILTPRGRWFESLSETLIFAPADRNTFDIGTVHFPTSLSTRTHAHCHSHANLHARFSMITIHDRHLAHVYIVQGCPSSWNFEIKIFNSQSLQIHVLRYYVKFCGDRSNCCRDIAFFREM